MKESDLFEELQRIAAHHDITVSTVNLKKYSYAIESGICKVHGRYRILLDRHLTLSEKIDVLIDALQKLSLDDSNMSPAVQKLFLKKNAPSALCGVQQAETSLKD